MYNYRRRYDLTKKKETKRHNSAGKENCNDLIRGNPKR